MVQLKPVLGSVKLGTTAIYDGPDKRPLDSQVAGCEIRVDVSNPAVTGDYYAPLEWNMAKGKYEMKSQETITGDKA